MISEPGFHGTWQATAQGRSLALTLVQAGASLRGRLVHSSDYALELAGTVIANAANGSATGPLGDTRFEAVLGGDTLLLALIDRNRATGKDVRLPMQFERLGHDAELGAPAPPAERQDPALVGRWVQAAMTGSGGQVSIAESRLAFDADGAFSRTACSGAGAMPMSGRWRTVGDVLFTRADGDAEWTAVANWRTNGDQLLLDTGHGARRWSRA